MNGAHEVSNIFRRLNMVDRPGGPESFFVITFNHSGNMIAEVSGEKEIAIKKQHVRIDVKKTKSDRSVAQGIKG
jgi:hypothetical protein